MVSFTTNTRSSAASPASTTKTPATSSPVPVPILKTSKPATSTTPSKRKITRMDLSLSPSSSVPSESSDVCPSPKKRTRVQFQSDLVIREANGGRREPEKSAAVVREEVRRAIQRHLSGIDSEAYDRIKEIFSTDPKKCGLDDDDDYGTPMHSTLKYHLMGLLSNVSSLDRTCNGLVNAVLSSDWLGRDESYVKLYIRFIGNLVAAQGTYLGSVLRMLVNYLGEVPKGTGRMPGYPVVPVSEIYARTHMALRHVMQLIPAASGALSPILSMQFPFDTDPARANIVYTRNLISLISYAPELQADVLALITEKLVKIDVQIQVDMEDFEDEVGEDLVHDVSPGADRRDNDDIDKDNASDASDDDDDDDDESVDAESKRVKVIKDNICKLDGMIDTLFEYYAPPFISGAFDDMHNALDILLSHFETIILPTYRSRHSQFLLFHFSQSSSELVDRFASTCIQLILNKSQPAVMRQSAAAYLASFVARGAHVSGEVARDVFDLLGTHLTNMRADYEPTCRGPDLRRYGLFYSTAQAMLYIFCFRWRDLTTAAHDGESDHQLLDLDPEDVTFPPSIKDVFRNAIYTKLNPLKVCSPAIVSEFARIAHHLRLLYVFPLLETNKRLRVSGFRGFSAMADPRYYQVEREIRAGDDLGYQLDAYFPFDPYHLPRSRRWLEGDYVEWRGIPGLDGQDDGSDTDSDGYDDDDEEDEGGDHDITGTDED